MEAGKVWGPVMYEMTGPHGSVVPPPRPESRRTSTARPECYATASSDPLLRPSAEFRRGFRKGCLGLARPVPNRRRCTQRRRLATAIAPFRPPPKEQPTASLAGFVDPGVHEGHPAAPPPAGVAHRPLERWVPVDRFGQIAVCDPGAARET